MHGDHAINQAAFAIHSQVHAARPDVIAAAHTHSVHGKAFSSLGQLLDPITQDSCAFYGDHVLFDDFTGVVLDPMEGKRIAHALGDNKAAILRNHGLLTVGHSVDEAAWWFITMERTCQAQLLAMAAGTPVHIDPEAAAGHPRHGRQLVRRLVLASSRSTGSSFATSPTCSTRFTTTTEAVHRLRESSPNPVRRAAEAPKEQPPGKLSGTRTAGSGTSGEQSVAVTGAGLTDGESPGQHPERGR